MTAPRWIATGLLLAATGCAAPSAPPPPAAAAPPAAPTASADAARAMLGAEETLETLDLGTSGTRTVEGEIRGYRSTAYAVAMQPGQTLQVRFEASSRTPGFNVFDVAQPQGPAIHRGETQGRSARLTARSATTFVIRPYAPRAFARRGAIFRYTLTVTRR
jgi:hypothetical protein